MPTLKDWCYAAALIFLVLLTEALLDGFDH
jgi:hypothetical protein